MLYDEAGLALTQHFEGCRLDAYADQGGVWTIGYGHTGPGVHGGMTVTQLEADAFLESDLAAAVTAVNRLVTATVTQAQFDALVDFTFNVGVAALAKSTLLREINRGNCAQAAPHFLFWDHCRGVVIAGLHRRRQAEADLFNGAPAIPGSP